MTALLIILVAVFLMRVLGLTVLRITGTQCTSVWEETGYGFLLSCMGGALFGIWVILDKLVGGPYG